MRVFTRQLDLLAEIDSYTNLEFIRRWSSPGEFTFTINRHSPGTQYLQKGNIISIDNTGRKVGIIKHKEIQLDSGGKITENWLIKGWTLSGLTRQRCTVPPPGEAYDVVTGSAETVMKHYVNNNMIAPTDTNRAFPMLVNTTDFNRGDNITWRSRFKDLHEELARISAISGLGWDITINFTNKRYEFDVYTGLNLSANQNVNPPVIFSPEFDVIEVQRYQDSDLSYKTKALVGGQGEGVDRELVVVGGGTGFDLAEFFVDARDIENTEELYLRGEERLAESQVDVVFEGEILQTAPFVYQKDYDLGDIVTVQNVDWGITMNTRIVEVKETYGERGLEVELTFGNRWPTFIDKIKGALKQMDAEVRR